MNRLGFVKHLLTGMAGGAVGYRVGDSGISGTSSGRQAGMSEPDAFSRTALTPQQFGVHPDPSGEDVTDQIQRFAAALRDPNHNGRHGYLPPGDYLLSDTVTFEDVKGLILATAGHSVRFLWAGPANVPMFRLLNVSRSIFCPFQVSVSGNGDDPALHSVFWSETKGGYDGVLNTTANRFIGISADGTLNGIRFGWYFTDEMHGQDANNDLCIWDGSGVANFTEAGFFFRHSQSKQHVFQNRSGAAAHSSRGKHALWMKHGSFHWLHGGATGCKGADFYIENMAGGDAVSIIGHESELSARLLEAVGVVGTGHSLTLRNVRFDPQDRLHPDGYGLIWPKAGSLALEDSTFGGGSRLRLGSEGIVLHVGIRRCGFSRDIRLDPDYNSPWDYVSAAGGTLEVEGNSFGDLATGTPQNLRVLRDGTAFFRAFGPDVLYTNNRVRTKLSRGYNGWLGRRIVLVEGDRNTELVNGNGPNALRLKSGANARPGWGAKSFVFTGTHWQEI